MTGAQAASSGAGTRSVASGGAPELPDAFPANPPVGSARHRTLSEQLADPSVITDYRPGACPYEYSETFGGPLGPRPVDAVRSVLRNLGRRPEEILCDPDPTAENRAYLSAKDGIRLARMTGLTPDQVNDALIALFASGWEPFANREPGLAAGARTAADHMPAPSSPRPPSRGEQGRFL